MGRSRNTALILVSQNAGDLLNEQVTNCLSVGVRVPLHRTRARSANVMALLGVEPSDEHKAVLRSLGNGECIFRDLDGRAGRIGVDLISDELLRWLDTNPTHDKPDGNGHDLQGGVVAGAGGAVMRIRLSRRLTLALVVAAGHPGGAVRRGRACRPPRRRPATSRATLAPEVIGGGTDGMMQAAGAARAASQPPTTNYGQFGMSGQFWHTHELGCSDITAVLGNSWANTIFLWAKAVDRLTITTYQAAATEGPLQSIKDVVDDIVTNLAQAMYWPYLQPIVILGAIWLAWYGLIRKRATTTAEGVIWMVLAVTVATWFLSRPRRLHRARQGRHRQDRRGGQLRLLRAARRGRRLLPAGARRHQPRGQGRRLRPERHARRRPERRRPVVDAGLQALADGPVRHRGPQPAHRARLRPPRCWRPSRSRRATGGQSRRPTGPPTRRSTSRSPTS